MIMDETLEFADATSVGTPNNTTVNVGDLVNTTVARDVGNGQTMYLVVQVVDAVTSGGAAIANFQLVSDATSTVAVDDTQTIHFRSDDFPVASLVAGFQRVFPLPVGGEGTNSYEQYLGFQIRETGSNALTGGTVNAFLTLDPTGWQSYPDATN